jgi:hypothetical protein
VDLQVRIPKLVRIIETLVQFSADFGAGAIVRKQLGCK